MSFEWGETMLAFALQSLVFAIAMLWAFFGNDLKKKDVLRCFCLGTILMVALSIMQTSFRLSWVVAGDTYGTLMRSPFANDNHLAGYLGSGFSAALSLMFLSRKSQQRILWGLAALLLASGMVYTHSRGGYLSMGVALLMHGILAFKKDLLRPSMLVGLGLGMFALLASFFLFTHLHQEGVQKLVLLKRFMVFSFSVPLFGVGRGAFGAAFAKHTSYDWRVEYPENIAVLFASEWGWGVTVLIMLWFVWFSFQKRDTWTWASWMAFVSLLVHDFFDFAMEIPSIAAGAALLFAMSAPSQHTAETRNLKPQVAHGRVSQLWKVTPLALLLLGMGYMIQYGIHARRDIREVGARLKTKPEYHAWVQKAFWEHPMEPTLGLLAAHQAIKHDPASVGKWLNWIFEMAPEWGEPHVLSAQILAQQGRVSQAILEMHESSTRSEGANPNILCPIVMRAKPSDVWGLTQRKFIAGDNWNKGNHNDPGKKSTAYFLNQCARCSNESELSRDLDSHLMQTTGMAEPWHREGLRLVARGKKEEALHAFKKTVELEPEVPGYWTTLLDHEPHEDNVKRAIKALPRSKELWRYVVGYAGAHQDEALLAEASERLKSLAEGNEQALAQAWIQEGYAQERMGKQERAIEAFSVAHSLDNASAAKVQELRVLLEMGDTLRYEASRKTFCMVHETHTLCTESTGQPQP